jgi:hypothetical protein
MTDLSVDLGALTARDLRKDQTLAPGAANFPAVIRKFLPTVYGTALALIPENPEAAKTVSTAVFETLAVRWKRIPKKAFLIAWLLRTTSFAIARERSRLHLKAKPTTPAAVETLNILKSIHRLKPYLQGPFLLNAFFQTPVETVATAAHKKPWRIQKWIAKAEAVLARKIRLPVPLLRDQLTQLVAILPEEITTAITSQFVDWKPAPKKTPLVADIIAAWRWLKFFNFAKRIAATIGSVVLVLLVVIATVAFLWTRGYILPRLIHNGQRDLAKQFPEMTKPARPFAASTIPPKTAADLYNATNIWAAKIRLTPQQWREIQPVNIPPVPNWNEGGNMKLRNPKASRSGLAGALGIDFHWSKCTFEFAGKTFKEVGVRWRGNGTYLQSTYGNKQSYKIDLNRNVKGQDIAGINTFNFVNSIPDFSYLKDALGQKLFRELGAIAPRTAYAYLTIDVPGKFANQPLGLYVLIEDIDSDFAKSRLGSKSAPIFKPVDYDLFGDWGDDWQKYAGPYDLKTKATPEQLARVIEFAKIVSHASDEEFARRLPEFLDLEEYAAFIAGHVLLSSYDGYLKNGQNFYMYLDPRSNKFGFIPWDQDHGWGEFGYVGTAELRETASIWHPAAYDNKFLKRVMKVEAFKKIYRAKLEQALAGPFTEEKINQEIDQLAAIIRPAVAAESDFRLQRFETAISTNWVKGPRNGRGMDGMEGPRAPAHQLKRFIQNRTKSIRDQLDGKSAGDRL